MSTDNINNKQFNLYSNEIQIALSVFDVTLQFNHNVPDNKEVLGNITMSPQHAKALMSALVQNISKYEELFGTIPQPTEEMFRQLQEEGKPKTGAK